MKTYTELELVEILVSNNNGIMKMIDNKEFRIEGKEVVCYRKNMIFPDKELSRNSFEFVIAQAKGLV